MPESIFLSYNFKDKKAVNEFYLLLMRSGKFNETSVYFFDNAFHQSSWKQEVEKVIETCDYYCCFIGTEIGDTQESEATYFNHNKKESAKVILVELTPGSTNKAALRVPNGALGTIAVENNDFHKGAQELCEKYLNTSISFEDDLPTDPHLFDYEKTIIDFFNIKKEIADIKGDSENFVGTEADLNNFLKSFISASDFRKLRNKPEKFACVRNIIKEKISMGCPDSWPNVEYKSGDKENLLKDIGGFRSNDAKVLVAALSKYHPSDSCKIPRGCMNSNGLTFPEAGPREKLFYPQYNVEKIFRVAILVSGGIAPGVNAVIDGITQRHYKYHDKEQERPNGGGRLEIWGLKNGFSAFRALADRKFLLVDKNNRNEFGLGVNPKKCTSEHIDEGGSIIGTSRDMDLFSGPDRMRWLKNIVQQLRDNHIRILYIIGGDGSMKAAHAISTLAKDMATQSPGWDLSVVGVPKTMDNDILWVWQTFGFMSAVEQSRELLADLYTEIRSNPRLGIVQLFGSDSGFVVSHAVLSSKAQVCDVALIPEIKFSMRQLKSIVKEKISSKNDKYGLVVLSETAIPTDALDYVTDQSKADLVQLTDNEKQAIVQFVAARNQGRRLQGQTSDYLRAAGLKIVSNGLREIDENLRVLTNEPRHILRAISPSTGDIIFGSRLGTLAVDNAMAGYSDFMISQWLTEFVLVPLKLVVLGRKRIPPNGVFWKSVLAKTQQPENLDS